MNSLRGGKEKQKPETSVLLLLFVWLVGFWSETISAGFLNKEADEMSIESWKNQLGMSD